MTDLDQRIANLSPSQKALLQARLRQTQQSQVQTAQKPANSDAPTIPRRTSSTRSSSENAQNERAPLSLGQQRLWLSEQIVRNASYNTSRAFRLRGELSFEALQAALRQIIARHEALRTKIGEIEGEPFQEISAVFTPDLPIIDLSAQLENERENAAEIIAQEEAHRFFDLENGPLLRTILLKMAPQNHVLLLTVHHVAFDGWSVGLFAHELLEEYRAASQNRASTLAPLPIQYADYAAWQQKTGESDAFAQQIEYWKTQLRDLEPLEIPTDFTRPALQSHRGRRISRHFPKTLSDNLKRVARQHDSTLFMTLLAAFFTLLYHHSAAPARENGDITIGIQVAGRNRVELENLIGYFANTILIRTPFEGDITFSNLLKNVRKTSLEAFENQDVSFEHLMRVLAPRRDTSRMPLHDAAFQLRNFTAQKSEDSALDFDVEAFSYDVGTSIIDLNLTMTERADGLEATFEYCPDLFAPETVEILLTHYENILQSIVIDASQPISRLALSDENERSLLLHEWSGANASAKETAPQNCVHEWFEAQAARTPNAIAVRLEDETLTYAELNERANKVAHFLRKSGVGAEFLVGICVERSPLMLVGVLGILKAGGAYLPLDPAYPRERLEFMLQDSSTRLLVTQENLRAILPENDAQIVCLDSDWPQISAESSDNSAPIATPENLAYIIYTSGSTGTPKGVLVPHNTLANHTEAAAKIYDVKERDNFLQFASLNFDASALEIYPVLMRGATLILRTETMLDSVSVFFQKCQDWQVSIFFLPTAFWHECVLAMQSENLRLPSSLRLVIFGGERVSPAHVATWKRIVGNGVQLFNVYGPTETTIVVTTTDITNAATDLIREIPIGRAISNAQTYVLDANLQIVPCGVAGELYIGGAGLARGYLNRAELTAEKFVKNPFGEQSSARLYKTGDVVRYRYDGEIEFLGRLDSQVKVRGFRIELGEIETAISAHPALQHAVVMVREDASRDKQIVAFCVAHDVKNSPNYTDLRDFLRERLPDYMIPTRFRVLDALPLNSNGKIDRRALLSLQTEEALCAERTVSEARDETESQLVALWQRVLDVPQVGIHDNFFELGGHSLLATRLFSQIKQEFEKSLPLSVLFQAPTIEKLAAVLRTDAGIEKEFDPLVALKSSGTRPPFYIVSPGAALFLSNLPQHLDAEQPLFALQAYGLGDGETPLTDVREMAALYVKAIRKVQAHGPYWLGGRCFGGIVALEVALQLEALGENVAKLVIFDSASPHVMSQISGQKKQSRNIAYYARRISFYLDSDQIVGLFKSGKSKQQLKNVMEANVQSSFQAGTGNLAQERFEQLKAINKIAKLNYQPSICQADIVLIRSKEFASRPRKASYLRWAEFTSKGFESCIMPGTHHDMFTEPNVRKLASQLARYLK